ncbi:MAG: TetR/AcrR family transcriptional regulator [Anaerolineales bacterium]|nr:TetR/AcrR family transcriptional regulator [Anaerolineales bacterium]MDW8276499.1 TetR/AcrR family transcriptional regulator [Anaerolineales bacterium]
MTRDDILQSAAQVFRQKGFHGASMADIAEAVQLQKASLYHHFGSKQEILLELLDRALEMVTVRMAEVMMQPIPPAEKLRRAMCVYLTTLGEQGDLVSVLLLEFRSLEPEFYSRHIPNRDRFEQMWREVIQQGVQSGAFHCESVSMTARALLGAMNWTVTWYRRDGAMTMEQIADTFADLFLDGLLVNHSVD